MERTVNSAPRLLPWPSPDGKPCYLVADHGRSRLSWLAECLTDALRVAESRGMRLPAPGGEDGGQVTQEASRIGDARMANPAGSISIEDVLRETLARGV
ncbi:hypothetical protein [Streptomyces sp. MMBL 11-3]|uniref:hypothetical protein n=1 Tax=Streptomyces sp. MMBL 11-3 TaxID=3382639 RepID=UPI0039B3F3DF